MTVLLLVPALILDAALGEPPWLWSRVPHPVVLMGRWLGWLDRPLNRGARRRAKGVLALFLTLIPVAAVSALPWFLSYGWVIEVVGAAILLAQRSLIDHVGAVARGLRDGLGPGRAAVGLIVGRDPAILDESGVARAAIESAAENFADGVIAPAFWFAVGGLPGIALYKAINTADSMIGHRTERFAEFGWAAARLDDLVNWIPARLAGALLCLTGGQSGAWRVMWTDARTHRSPNAGWPEAALAAGLGIALGGPRRYAGEGVVEAPYINAAGRHDLTPDDIDEACRLLWTAWAGLIFLAVIIAVLLA